MSILDRIRSWFAPFKPLPSGVTHYQTPPDAPQQYRLHLRLEPDGRGLLTVNAATILHLNQTGAEYARLLIEGADEQEAARAIARRYRVSREIARRDFVHLRERIQTLATTPDLCPVTFLDMERAEPFSAETTAPYRVDLALTYRMDESANLDSEAGRRVERELTREEWEQILALLWQVGVPHVCFTGGEPTLRDDLTALVQYAEEQGLVTGLLTDGQRLGDQTYLNGLLVAGLDHLQITLLSHQAEVHDAAAGQRGAWERTTAGLRNALEGDIYVTVHIVVTPANADSIADTVAYVADLGAPAVALSSPLHAFPPETVQVLQEALALAEETVHLRGLTLVWDLAAPYSHSNPVEIEAGLDPEAVIRQHLYVEPDGDVLPAQGYNLVLGNLLRDPWESIWNHPERLRLGQGETEGD